MLQYQNLYNPYPLKEHFYANTGIKKKTYNEGLNIKVVLINYQI